MSVETEEDVAEALRQIGAWYGPDRAADTSGVGPPTINGSPLTEDAGLRPRLALIAALVLVAAGVVGLALADSSPGQDPAGLDGGVDRATIVDLCLDMEAGYELGDLAADGTVHLFGDPAGGQVSLVLSSGAVHVACGLAQRDDGDWFRVVSLAGTHLPLASADDLNVLVAVQLGEQTYIAGQVGSAIDTIEVERVDGVHDAQIEDGWWGVSFDAADDQYEPFPPFSVRLTTSTGIETAQGSDLLAPTPLALCARDAACREERLTELQELARGSGGAAQTAILADGVVTEDEYRSSLRAWGDCIAESTGVSVSYGDSGLFTVHDASEEIVAAFERCKERHIALVAEAVGLGGTAGD